MNNVRLYVSCLHTQPFLEKPDTSTHARPLSWRMMDILPTHLPLPPLESTYFLMVRALNPVAKT